MTKWKILHLLNFIINFAIGLYCVLWARDAAAALGIAFLHTSGGTDFRATYGGITLACALFFGLAFLDKIESRAGLWFSALFYAGLGLTRFMGILIDGPQLTMMYFFLAVEVFFFSASVLLLRQTDRK